MIYLAIPYSHPDKEVRERRFRIANRVAAKLIKQGKTVFSPISHSHPINECGTDFGWKYWKPFDIAMLSMCNKIIVIDISGWDTSEGVACELEFARRNGISIEHITPTPEDLMEEDYRW